jgi:ParB-like chromosome segregation protein Spo0J
LTITSADKIVQRATGDLIPYANNSRTHSEAQILQIAASIREFGFTNPVLIDGENGIIAGHGRVLAAQKLGLDRVPCIELAHLSPTQRRAYLIADNKLALNAGWDKELLSLELEGLGEDGFDLGLTGFTLDEIGELNADAEPEEKSQSGKADDGLDGYKEQYGVIVVCRDEEHQRETFERLVELGYEPKVVVT